MLSLARGLLLFMWLLQLSSFHLRKILVLPNGRGCPVSQAAVHMLSASPSHPAHSPSLAKPRVIFVLGGPASGKGTQCLKLSEEFGMRHLSAGDLLREEQASGSEDGKLIDSIIKEGKIVPVQITLDLLKRAILDSKITSNRYLIDGFPRNWDNLHGWEGSMTHVCVVETVMFIDCPEAELEKRLLSRGLTSGRSDDNIATAKKRFQTFYAATMPVIKHYEEKNMLIRVRGDASVDNVYNQLRAKLLPLLEKDDVAKEGLGQSEL